MTDVETTLSDVFKVQNGTGVTTSGVEHYVQRFLSLNQKASTSIIDLSTTLVEAEGSLKKEEFGSFCEEVGIAKGKSFHKKLRTIGKNAERFGPHLDQLPNCWTTIYALAQMDAEKFRELVAAGILSPKMKAKDIHGFLGTTTKANRAGGGGGSKNEDASEKLVFSFGDLDDDTKRQLAAEINELAERWKVTVSISGLEEATPVADEVPLAA